MVEINLLYNIGEYEERIKELLQICMDESQIVFTKGYIEEQYVKLLLNLKNNSARLVVAVRNNELIGMAWIYEIERYMITRMHIAFVAVLPIAQKKGIGNLIFKKIKEIAYENNIQELDLNVSYMNGHAIEFYKKHGFIEESFTMKLELQTGVEFKND